MIKTTLLILFSLYISLIKSQITDTITVGFTKSAYLMFADSNIRYDVGSELVIVRHAGNKLILQAEEENFEETNMLVEIDSKVYLFLVRYNKNPEKYLYNFANATTPISPVATITKSSRQEAIDSLEISKNEALKDQCTRLVAKESQILSRGIIKYKMGFYVRDIVIENNKIYMKFEINNKGNIPYKFDFSKYYVKGVKKKIKGESIQIVELNPLYEYNKPKVIEGKQTIEFVIVFDKFSLTENKKLVIEYWEDNGKDLNIEGGRKISFDIFSKDVINIGVL